MAFDAGSVVGHLKLDSSDWEKGTKNASKANQGMAKSMFNAQVAFAALQKAVQATTDFLKKSIDVFIQQEKVEKQLETTLKSTGHAAGLAKDELIELAKGLQEVTTFGDEAIIGAENILLTFTKIGSEVFPEALESVLNMSEALGTGLKEASIQVGKALQDPIQGVAALRRVGVQLTDAQEEAIRAMVELGDVAGAQTIILAELETQFGGSARAAAETFGGAMQQAQNKIGDVMERIGAVIVPMVVEALDSFAKWAKDNEEGIIAVFKGIAGAIGLIVDAAKVLFAIINAEAQNLKKQLIFQVKVLKGKGKTDKEIEEMLGVSASDIKKITDEMFAEAVRAAVVRFGTIGKAMEELGIKNIETILKALESAGIVDQLAAALAKGFEPEFIAKSLGLSEEDVNLIIERYGLIAQASTDTTDTIKENQDEVAEKTEETGDKTEETFDDMADASTDAAEAMETVWTSTLDKLIDALQKAGDEFGTESLQWQEAWTSLISHLSGQINEYSSLFTEIWGGFTSLSDTRIENELLNNQKEYDQKKQLINKTVIDEKLRKQKLEQLEKDFNKKQAALKKEQWKKEQRASLISAIINTALGVTKALSGSTPPLNFILAALVGAAGAVEIAAIASQDAPQFQFGGVARPGPAIVGEAGPELINVGSTSRIFPADETARITGRGGVEITNNFMGDINSDLDVDRSMELVGARIENTLRGI